MKELTPKEQKFAELCVELGNQSEAYRQAYNPKKKDADWIKVRASELANKSNIKVTIESIKKDLKQSNKITKQVLIDYHLEMVAAWKELWELGQKKNKDKDEVQRFYLLKEMVKGSDYRGSLVEIARLTGANEPERIETKDTSYSTKWG